MPDDRPTVLPTTPITPRIDIDPNAARRPIEPAKDVFDKDLLGTVTIRIMKDWKTTLLGSAKGLITLLGTFLGLPHISGIPDDQLWIYQSLGVLLAIIQMIKGKVEKDADPVTPVEP